MDRIDLSAGDYALSLAPAQGGSVARFTWRGEDIMRPAQGEGVLAASCFPLVPFSNRIADSRFEFHGHPVQLLPNHPAGAPEPVLHGFGWLAQWAVASQAPDNAVLVHEHAADGWPWAYRCAAEFDLDETGLRMRLTLENLSAEAMPAGLGFHPYFPRNERTQFHSLHASEYEAGADCLPRALDERPVPIDWWDGLPVATRHVDTVYGGREGVLSIAWPERGIGAVIEPSADLAYTTVYVPEGEDFFCVEPVSHATDAFNATGDERGTRVLAPGESWTVSMRIAARMIA